MTAPHPFPLEPSHLVRTTQALPYNGWTIWGYEELVRAPGHNPVWVPKALAVRGEEVLMPMVGNNIRRMVDDAIAQVNQMEIDLAGLVVKEGAPTGLMPL